jgi:hypothetical protein
MTTFRGGPAEGKFLSFNRHPLLLRVAVTERGECDVLDLPEDKHRQGESLYVYYKETLPTVSGFACGRSGCTRLDDDVYALYPDQPPHSVMADYKLFGEWCYSEMARDDLESLIGMQVRQTKCKDGHVPVVQVTRNVERGETP